MSANSYLTQNTIHENHAQRKQTLEQVSEQVAEGYEDLTSFVANHQIGTFEQEHVKIVR